ncbi:MAG: hypothetical protein Q7R22_011670 [Verrucomicrobiota bacterium JB025]
MSDSENPLSGLGNFTLGPSWARASDSNKEKNTYSSKPGKFKDRGEDRRDNRRDDRRTGDRRRDDRGDGRRPQRGRGRKFDDRRDGPPPRRDSPPAEGVKVTLNPDQKAVHLIAKEVQQVARVYSLFDIAKTLLAERKRTRALFQVEKGKPALFKSKLDDALFLTRAEALRYLWNSDLRDRFLKEETVEVEPPSGNFQLVARCGMSGEWLGPPNFHAYQTNLHRIHRERFSHLPFAVYSAKVRTERSEEAVNQWLEAMTKKTRWRLKTDEEQKREAAAEAAAIAAETEAAQAENKAETPAGPAPETTTPETASADTTPETTQAPAPEETPEAPQPTEESAAETTAETPDETTAETQDETTAETPDETAAETQDAPAADDFTWFDDQAQAERALADYAFDLAFKETRTAEVSNSVKPGSLSPALFTSLKNASIHVRRHPAMLIPAICRAVEAEHLPIFKRKGKLLTGPARPHPLPKNATLAERPGVMVEWIRANSPAKLEGLWKAVLPEGATAPPSEYAADLFWLLQQGHILLFTDDTLVVQEVREQPQAKKKSAKQQKDRGDQSSTKSSDQAAGKTKGTSAKKQTADDFEQDERIVKNNNRCIAGAPRRIMGTRDRVIIGRRRFLNP